MSKHLHANKLFKMENRVKTRTRQREAVTARYQKLKESTAIQDEQSEIPSHEHRYRCWNLKILVRMITLVSIFGMIFVTIKHNSSFGHSTDASSTAVYKHDILITSPYYLNTVNPQVFITTYSLVLTPDSPTYCRDISIVLDKADEDDNEFIQDNYGEDLKDFNENIDMYYYEIVYINVNMSGYYNIESNSIINTYGYIYNGSFDPSNPSKNLLLEDDDNGGIGQFKLTYFLWPEINYILVTTTFLNNVTGSILITVSGPSFVIFTERTTTLTTSSIMTTQTSTSSIVISRYSATLPSDSQTYCRTTYSCSLDGYYYYESIEVHVNKTGIYRFISDSNLDTYGYIYINDFDPSNPSENILSQNDDAGGHGQFKLIKFLRAWNTYILVVTTYSPNRKGRVIIIASGPSTISFTHSTSHRSSTTTTTTTTFETTTAWSVESTYSSSWNINSQRYCRTGCSVPRYYYEGVKVSVLMAGKYSIASKSIIDTYGYLYNNSFDRSNPSRNLLLQDDDSGGNKQFKLTHFFQPEATYILIATTFDPYMMKKFSISASGPGSVIFHS
ncbi:unnamed protein product [Adineta steineri]|uniref:Uncharacterized protein n=1 Tax=Adineta steineri TaxID=433720 RepID=A0A815S4K3_9BILA|nr:unnamed protein product [Adineta steineri]CAF1487031.1 unnamed protein product [Adineta steineri]